ncbi:MAG: hypothetical protein IPP66_20620 [Anaerolineales bacterium]|nr:hypothetical protein [Anaerolineales bacterium]
MKTKSLVFLLVIAIFVSACVPAVASPEPISTTVEETSPIPTQTQEPSQPEIPVVPSVWKTIRDPRYGFGLAVPCWWLVSPIPAEGVGGVMIIKNYDEAYFNANSKKGFWEWPNGTLKLDIVIMEGVDPAKSETDAYVQFIDPTTTGLVSAETQQISSRTVTVVTLSNLVNTNDPHTKLFIFRLAPDKLLIVAPTPQNIIDAPDFQAVLQSIVLTADEQVILPTITPAPALINASCVQ